VSHSSRWGKKDALHGARQSSERDEVSSPVVGTILICGVGFGDAVLQLSPPPPGRPSRPPSRAPSNPAVSPPVPSQPPAVLPRYSQAWWGPRWLRAGPVRSLPRNRGGNRRRPREVGTAGRVAAGEGRGGGGGSCRSWGALLASISRRWLRVARARPAARTRPRPPSFSGVSVSGSDTRS